MLTYILACAGLFAFIQGNTKSTGVVLVELMEIYPEKSTTALLWDILLFFSYPCLATTTA